MEERFTMKVRHVFLTLLAAAVAGFGLSACAPKAPVDDNPPPDDAMAGGLDDASSAAGASGDVVKLNGAGASFPAPLYDKWFKDYSAAHPGVQVDYQSVGSGSGVKSFIGQTVDFGASDAAMKDDEIAQVEGGCTLIPMTAGAVVLTYNLEGVSDLKLSRDAYVGIFLGKVTKWNDPLIADANPGATLPDEAINAVERSDGSGTTYVFTTHLAGISPEFKDQVGVDKLPDWPVGTKAKGNEGVSAQVKQTPGSIGYVEYGYAKQLDLPIASLENKAGKYVAAGPETSAAALANIELPESLIAWEPDPAGDDSFPIVSFTWIMVYHHYDDAAKASALKDVLLYGLTDGQNDADALGYVPLPDAVAATSKAAVEQAFGSS